MENLMNLLLDQCRSYTKTGKVASYIPALTKANPSNLGICLLDHSGNFHEAGDSRIRFTAQSTIKPVLLLQALIDNGEDYVRSRVGVEATGKPFDAINVTDQNLLSDNINPMVNMGAIAMCSLIKGETYTEKFNRLLALTRTLADNPDIRVNEEVYLSEKATANKNRSLAFLLKSYGLLEDDVEEVLDCYFRACSIELDCRDLASIAFTLSNKGCPLDSDTPLFEPHFARYINAVLMTCGMYDGSGEFAIKVGVPAKSGVGGGIMAVVPNRMGIGIYGPALDKKGNSAAGIQLLKLLSAHLDLSIF